MITPPRPLLADDLSQMTTLGKEAFGDYPGPPAPVAPADYPPPGRHSWGTFDGDVLVAKVMSREYESFFHGHLVPTNGIAGVAVSAEHRGAGLLDDLMRAVLDEGMRDRSEVLSTLFPTAPGIYRRYGYELISSYDTIELPTSRLATVPAPERTTLRRAGAADFDAVRHVYSTWAAAQNGPLTRTGPSFGADADEFIAAFSGVTLAVEGDDVVGYASWQRGTGYDASSSLEVSDLVALTGDATRALWRMLASFGTVTGHVRLMSSGRDAARLVLPFGEWRVVHSHPYMLRVHDVAGAFSGLPLPEPLQFSVAGDLLDSMNGHWSLEVHDAMSVCVPGTAGGPTFAPRGVALLYAGAASCGDLRMAGLLTGGSTDGDRRLDTLFGRRQLHIRDYF